MNVPKQTLKNQSGGKDLSEKVLLNLVDILSAYGDQMEDYQKHAVVITDEEKNQLNLKKHGIDFETAMFVFNDLQRIEIYDVEHSISEDRYNTIGMVHDVLFVVYTERKENIRLISARLATKTERSIYYDTDSYFG